MGMNSEVSCFFALICKHSGTSLHTTEEDANPLSVHKKDWRLVLVN